MLGHLIGVRENIRFVPYIKNWILYLIFGTAMFFAVRKTGQICGITAFSLVLEIVTGVVIYSIFTFIYLYLTKDNIMCKYLGLLKKNGLC